MRRIILLFLLPLTGCYNIVMLNVGSSAHEAASAGTPLAPEVQCAALAQRGAEAGPLTLEAMKTCEQAVYQQKLEKKR